MVLEALLGAKLGSDPCKFQRHKQMPMPLGQEKKFAKVRERPRLWLPRAAGGAGRSRTLGGESGTQQNSQSISSGSRANQVLIQTENHSGCQGENHG